MEKQIDLIVTRELGDTAVVTGRFEAGLMHDTYEVRFEEDDYILQLSDADEERKAGLELGLNCYLMLQDTEIPVPQVVTENVRAIDGRTYTLVERLSGTSGWRDISPERVLNAGKYLAKIHQLRSFERAGWLQFDGHGLSVKAFQEGSLDRWRHRKVQNNAKHLRSGGLENVGREVERLFNRENVKSGESFQVVLSHNDYSPDNLLFQNDTVTGIIDFDHAFAGDRYRDIVKAANGFWMHDPCVDWDVRATFYEGYRNVTGLDSSFEAIEPYNRVETLAVTVGGMLDMNEFSDYEKSFYSERLLEAIERVPRT